MKGRLFLVHWNAEAAAERACMLRDEDWFVDVESVDGATAYQVIQTETPDVVLIDLSRKPSHGREIARSLRESSKTRELPIVFVDGDEIAIKKVRSRVPDALFTTWDEVTDVLAGFTRPEDSKV